MSIRFTEAGLHDVHRTIAEALMRVAVPEVSADNVTSLFMKGGPVRGEA